jgi:hypothetical protein
LKRTFVLAALFSAALGGGLQVGGAQPAAAAPGIVPKQVEAWAFCGVRPGDPTAQATANAMAEFGGIDATFGPCNDPSGVPPYPYTPTNPGLRYVDPATYMQVVQINANAGMKTVVYDARIWSTLKADRDAAVAFWAPVLDHIKAWDLGDEWNPPPATEWATLNTRWDTVLADVAVRTKILPYTNHDRNSLDESLRDLPGSASLLSFTQYEGDLGAAIARQFDSQTSNLMCGINAYAHFVHPNGPPDFQPTADKIRNGMQSLIAAGCDSFLVFGGARVYDTPRFDPVSLADQTGQPTDWATALLEGAGFSSYKPVGPSRLLETRGGLTTVDNQFNGIGPRTADSVTQLQVGGRAGVRTDATTAILNVTVTGATAGGYVTVFPCGATRPTAAQVNYAAGIDVATAVVAKLDANGRVCVYTLSQTDMAIDVNGYIPKGSTYTPLSPARLLETRTDPALTTVDGQYLAVGFRGAGSTTELQVTGRGGVPTGATDVVLNVTATNVRVDGFVTVFPCGERPTASHVNFTVGSTVTNAVTAPLRIDGRLCVYTLTDIDLIIDVNGYYPANSAFVSLVPARALDTRVTPALPVEGIELAPATREDNPPIVLQVAGARGVPANAKAVILNVTVVDPKKAGFITVFPCGDARPNASNLNFRVGQTVANMVVAEIGQRGSICIHRSAETQVVVDITNIHP